jgi:hypothetical protein
MPSFTHQSNTFDHYTWEIIYNQPHLPSPTLRIDFIEFYEYYYGVKTVNNALLSHFLFRQIHSI